LWVSEKGGGLGHTAVTLNKSRTLLRFDVSVFDQSMKLIGVLDVEVAIDTDNLQQKIRSVTGSHGIRVRSISGQIVLSGVAGNRHSSRARRRRRKRADSLTDAEVAHEKFRISYRLKISMPEGICHRSKTRLRR
jgi:Flp pilus assembly secretin CpaC